MVRLFRLTGAFVFRNSDASQLGSKSSSAFQISQTTARAVRQGYQASVYLFPMVTRLRLRLFCGFERTVYRRNTDATRYAWWEVASGFKVQVLGIARRSPHCMASSKSEPPRIWMSGALAHSLGPCQARFGSLDTETCAFSPVSSNTKILVRDRNFQGEMKQTRQKASMPISLP